MKKNVIAIFSVIVCVFLVIGLAACGSNSDDKNDIDVINGSDFDADGTHTETILVMVRDAYFAKVDETRKLLYKGEEICDIENGAIFEATVTLGLSETIAIEQFTTSRENCTFVVTEKRDSILDGEEFSKRIVTLIEVPNAETAIELIDIGGKVVLDSDGETRVAGARLYVNGNLAVGELGGNFILNNIPIGAQVSIEIDGYSVKDIGVLPYYEVNTNIGHYTFRLLPAQE